MTIDLRRCVRVLSVATVAAMLMAGCGGAGKPSASTPAKSDQDRPILTSTTAAAALKAYDEHNNAAMPKAGPPSYDGAAYDVVDIGPLLEQDLTSARIGKNTKQKVSTPFTTHLRELYAPTTSAGFALSSVTYSDAPRWVSLSSLVRDGGEWKKEMDVQVRKGADLPAPLDPGTDSTATAGEVKRVRAFVTEIADFWSTLRKPADLDLGDAPDAYFAKTLSNVRASTYKIKGGVDVGQPCRTNDSLGDAVRVTRVRGGLLALLCLQVRDHYTFPPGVSGHETGTVAKLYGPRLAGRSQHRWLVSLALSVPEHGRPTVLGTSPVPLVQGR